MACVTAEVALEEREARVECDGEECAGDGAGDRHLHLVEFDPLEHPGPESAAADEEGEVGGADATTPTHELVQERGRNSAYVEIDVAEQADAEKLVDRTVEVLGGLDIVVNVAGIFPKGTITETTPEDWSRTFDVNVDGIYHVTRQAIPHLTDAEHGRIINFALWGIPAYVVHGNSLTLDTWQVWRVDTPTQQLTRPSQDGVVTTIPPEDAPVRTSPDVEHQPQEASSDASPTPADGLAVDDAAQVSLGDFS
jgi:NAD(P)-dependent dehydrogenase (short-subunit alcohol dehydrogenase family)